jgi:RNA methyltransferase, TrmH family
MPEIISSSSNPTIKLARALHQKKNRDESRLFLVEGILHVGEAAQAGWEFDSLLYCPERLKSEFGQRLVAELEGKGARCLAVSEPAFESFAEKENPQGIAAILRQKQRKLQDFSAFQFAAALVTPQDPGNVGTILRTIDAVGADGLIQIDGGVEPYHPSTVRASMGTIFWKPFYPAAFQEFSQWAKAAGVRIIGTSAHASVDVRQVSLDSRPTILLLGSEQKGLLPEQMAVCDDLISIQMHGRATSLNLAVAAGIFMYALMGQTP